MKGTKKGEEGRERWWWWEELKRRSLFTLRYSIAACDARGPGLGIAERQGSRRHKLIGIYDETRGCLNKIVSFANTDLDVTLEKRQG